MGIWKILKDGEVINTIVADRAFARIYAEMNGFEVEEEIREEPEPKPDPVEERLTALEDAMCEMDAANAASIAALEDALCEIDAGGM